MRELMGLSGGEVVAGETHQRSTASTPDGRRVAIAGAGGGVPLPVTLVFDYPTIAAIAEKLTAVWDLGAPASAAPADDLAELSDADAEALLEAELARACRGAADRGRDELSDTSSTVKRALLEVRGLRAQLAAATKDVRAPIAIVGMALRLPGGVNGSGKHLTDLFGGQDPIVDIPADRWPIKSFDSPDPDAPGKMSTRQGGFINFVDRFDAAFFGISPVEAASMDPQQRLLLEIAWEAIEDSGVGFDAMRTSRAGVYVGMGNVDYGRAIFSNRQTIDPYYATGTLLSVAAGRLSYTLGLTGPALTVDTACSASLASLHLACQALRLRECNAALAGGINLILGPEINVCFTKGRMMAPSERCRTFDADADGYVRGEGAVMFLLKRLDDAEANADRILAVVRGTALNQDGRSSGLTAPSGPAQQAVIQAALANAGAKPDEIVYVETHGTGTPLGDPIELGALWRCLPRADRAANPFSSARSRASSATPKPRPAPRALQNVLWHSRVAKSRQIGILSAPRRMSTGSKAVFASSAGRRRCRAMPKAAVSSA